MISYSTEFLALLGGFAFILFIFVILILALILVSSWKIFEKAGKQGWQAIVPYYNTYVLYEILHIKEWFPLYLVATSVFLFFGGTIETLANFVLFGLSVYSNILLAKAFDKEIGFTIGLIFLPFIFYPILAFGDSKYYPENL